MPGESDRNELCRRESVRSPTLTFSVKNTGNRMMNIDGQRPNVTGDFLIVEGLNSTIGAGSSDTFQVKLIDTSPGDKTGTIVINRLTRRAGTSRSRSAER